MFKKEEKPKEPEIKEPVEDRNAFNCPVCLGSGLITDNTQRCPNCGGTGKK